MPAITSLGISAATPAAKVLAALAVRIGRSLKQLAGRLKNRRDAFRLADLDDRMLSDIGICRSDLRDAYAGSLWDDPSELLARRAVERRVRKQRTTLTCVSQSRRQTALFGAPAMLCYPRADRSGRYLV